MTHGEATGKRSAEHRAWNSMRGRCFNPKNKGYKYYGGRGITVCERWNKYENFLADMGRRPTPLHSIDRINNDGDYEPNNCRWATDEEQNSNQRSNRIITCFRESLTLAQWSKRTGLHKDTISSRLKSGMEVERALNPELFRKRRALSTPAAHVSE